MTASGHETDAVPPSRGSGGPVTTGSGRFSRPSELAPTSPRKTSSRRVGVQPGRPTVSRYREVL